MITEKTVDFGTYLPKDYYEKIKYRGIPASLQRFDKFMQQQVFNSMTSESEFMRYIQMICTKDYNLANGMIPLGSCTMKLNAANAMAPITFPGFGNIHPFAPKGQWPGYTYMAKELEQQLSAICHYDQVSLQPNSGANGEFAGLSAIRKYHQSRGDHQRKICLIPTSAHGTNPATAAICGMTIIPVLCTDKG